MIDLRTEFENILKQYGHNICLQRRIGGEYSKTLEKHTVRNRFYDSSAATATKEHIEGITVSADNMFYFKWDVNPGEGDRIYEEFPNQKNKQTLWLIDYAQPYRGLGGRIVYWITGVTRQQVNAGDWTGSTFATRTPPPSDELTESMIDGGVI